MNLPAQQPARLSFLVWAATCVLGFGYWLGALGRSGVAFHELAELPGYIQIPWKGACTLGLAISVALAGPGQSQRLIVLALTISSVADIVLVTGMMVASGVLFSISHLIVMLVFWRHRQAAPSSVRRIFAVCVPLVSFGLSILAIQGTDLPVIFALYPFLSGVMAATAIVSRFPLWLCGLGATIFICSDVLVVAYLGVLDRNPAFGFVTWMTYFVGYALLARGAAMTTHDIG